MISLPPGFDYGQLITFFATAGSYVVGSALLIAAYRLIKKVFHYG